MKTHTQAAPASTERALDRIKQFPKTWDQAKRIGMSKEEYEASCYIDLERHKAGSLVILRRPVRQPVPRSENMVEYLKARYLASHPEEREVRELDLASFSKEALIGLIQACECNGWTLSDLVFLAIDQEAASRTARAAAAETA